MPGLIGSKGMKSLGRYGGVGFELLGSIAVGFYGGQWLDGKFGTHWLALVGFLIGCYAGFRSLFRAAKTMQRDLEREEKIARGEDPWAPKSKFDDDSSPSVDEASSEPTAEEDPPPSERTKDKQKKKKKDGFL